MQVEIYQNQRQDCKLFKTRLLKFLWPFVFEVNIEIIRHLYKRCTSWRTKTDLRLRYFWTKLFSSFNVRGKLVAARVASLQHQDDCPEKSSTRGEGITYYPCFREGVTRYHSEMVFSLHRPKNGVTL